MSAIDIQIDELVLHGFAPGDRDRIGEALRAELARLIAESGAPEWMRTGGQVAALDGGSFAVVAGARPEAVGAQVARAVYGGLTTMGADYGRPR